MATEQTLQGIPNVEVMLDDTIVTGKSDAAHLENLEAVPTRRAEKNLRINVQKFHFFMEHIEYCGHGIDKDGLHKTNAKIEAVQNAPCPKDGLSRVPMPTGKTVKEYDVMDVFYMNHMDVLPITASVIQNECSKDPILSKVLERTQHGWPQVSPVGLEPNFSKRHELSIFHGCIMWGIRVVVPHKLRNQILHELHEGHIGIVKMKGLARSYVWWPGIDQDIESLAKKCQGCQKVQFEAPTVPLHPWEWPIKPWQRIHVDYAGPFMGHMFLIIVDAHSKWPEVLLTGSTSSERTVELLRGIFPAWTARTLTVTMGGNSPARCSRTS